MPAFLKLVSADMARSALLDQMHWPLADVEDIPTATALGRVTAKEMIAPHELPEFPRSTVDGYAVRARDTFGAGPAQPSYLQLVGEIAMGTAPPFSIVSGQSALIHTGGMLPAGADAVVMLEHASSVLDFGTSTNTRGEIEILKSVTPGENIINPGEDVKAGQTVLERGSRLGPAEIGGLMALGLTVVPVVRRPIVAIISCGNEVVEPAVRPPLGKVRDVNAPALAALVVEAGGSASLQGIVSDNPGETEVAARSALSNSDVVVITAGSSASTHDLTAAAIAALGKPGVLVHGISIRPGKPTILGVAQGKPVIGLPGNPVSALVIARLFLVPVIHRLLGMKVGGPRATVSARLTVNLPSQAGREDWWPVQVRAGTEKPKEWLAEPIFGRSNLIFNLASADGLICIPSDATGIEAGQMVEVELL